VNKTYNFKAWLYLGLLLVGCGTAPNGNGTATPGPTIPTSTPTQVTLATSLTSLKSDGSNFAVITATVLDANFAAVSNATVQFAATGGQISAASSTTGANGEATVNLAAGASKTNQVATVTATLLGISPTVTTQIPVQITGTTITLTSQTTNITDNGTTTDTLTLSIKDAGNNPVYNTPVTFTQSGTGAVTISPATINTDINGTATVVVTGTVSGNVTIRADAAGNIATQAYTVATTGTAFGITSPTIDPYALTANVLLPIQVNAPGVAIVTFVTSLGEWVVGGLPAGQVLDVAPVAGVVNNVMFRSNTAGIANIQVFNAAARTTLATTSIAVSQPAISATDIRLQSNVNVVAPSVAGATNIATLTATVRDIGGQVVGGAPVHFSIPKPTGSGETLSPVIAFTNSAGVAQTIFTSGASSSGAQGVDIYASVISPAVGPSITNIVVGGTAGSIVIGAATKIVEVNPTTYSNPFSVQVADSNGNGVANATVTLKVWPKFYSFGRWYSTNGDNTSCVPVRYNISGSAPLNSRVPNEDVNKNLLLDTGEDKTITVNSVVGVDLYGNPTTGTPLSPANDRVLTPASSSAGTLLSTVTTNSNGIANFNLTFLKQFSAWIVAEITASTQVLGSETTTVSEYSLYYSKADAAACLLPDSPFNESIWPK